MTTTTERDREKQMPPVFSPLSWRHENHNDSDDDRRRERWARSCATVGAAIWAGIAVLTKMGIVRIGAIELMFLFAPLMIVPLGIELGRVMGASGRTVDAAQKIQPLGAALAVVAMLFPPGRGAGLMALGWMATCGVLAVDGVKRIVGRSVGATLVQVALAVGRIDLAVGGAWLVASRLGIRPMGIQEPIGLLTAVHFHFAGFATATIAAATLAFAARHGSQRWLRRIVLLVLVLPYLVAVGFVISFALKMAAAVLFSASVAGLAVFLRSVAKQVGNATARTLLQVAAGAVFAGMLFATAYAVADFVGSDAPTIPQMTRTHGILNAVGFCLPGLLGWLVEQHQVSLPRS